MKKDPQLSPLDWPSTLEDDYTMQYPESKALGELVSILLDEDLELVAAAEPKPVEDLASGYASICLDEDGTAVCVIMADLCASISLGGQVLLLPQHGLESQLEDGAASAPVLEGATEVFSNLGAALNKKPGNPRIRSLVAARLDSLLEGEHSWIKNAGSRMDYEGDFLLGRGQISIFSRD